MRCERPSDSASWGRFRFHRGLIHFSTRQVLLRSDCAGRYWRTHFAAQWDLFTDHSICSLVTRRGCRSEWADPPRFLRGALSSLAQLRTSLPDAVTKQSTSEFGGTQGVLLVSALFLALNGLLRVPDLLVERFPLEIGFYLSDPSRLYYFFSLDLFCLFSLLVFFPRQRGRRWIYYVLTGAVLFLLAYRTYDALVVSSLHRDPIVYADYSHTLGAIYLLLNASISAWMIVGVAGALALVAVLGWYLPGLFRTAHRHVWGLPLRRGVLATHLIIWPLVGFAALQERGIERQTYQEVCLLTMECVAYNIRASVALSREMGHTRSQSADSTYVGYRQLNWSDPPSIYLVMLESYGTVLAEDPHIDEAYDRLMGWATRALRGSGWETASTKSVAPVFGGLSWLSAATVLTGTPVSHQPTYDVMRRTLSRYPHLVWLLERQGYETGLLQPPVRARPGLRVRNPYAFDRTIHFDDLDYRGPAYGWGIVPDQYSLSVAHKTFVQTASRPFFLLFETVTSHGRWKRQPPPLVADPESLNETRAERAPARLASAGPVDFIETEELTRPERYFRYIRYEWRVLVDYLRKKAPKNSLVIVFGDHQPFFAESESFATPVHVLSQDEGLVRRFTERGFAPGLRFSDRDAELKHAGLYSLLVRVLTAHHGDRGTARQQRVPSYHPEGVGRSALRSTHP